jgi:Ca-activated chloride channel family protein
MQFASPWMFLLMVLIPPLVYLRLRQRRAALRFSSTEELYRAGSSLRQQLLAIPTIFRVVALLLLVIALARPQFGVEHVVDVSEGIAIEMVVDRSTSMGEEMSYQGATLTRLDMVKRVFRDFVLGDKKELPGRPNDMIGMVSFARYADTICPLTLSHDTLTDFLDTVDLARERSEDGTAIGDGVTLAAARLHTAEETLARQSASQRRYNIRSKVIILLTDGRNNAGDRTVEEAAALAAKWGIKIYAIGVGGRGLSAFETIFGNFNLAGPAVDSRSLTLLAEKTGGLFRMAEDAESLRSVYEEIDQLEKSKFDVVRYVDYSERFMPYALGALMLVGLEVVLAGTVLRTTP